MELENTAQWRVNTDLWPVNTGQWLVHTDNTTQYMHVIYRLTQQGHKHRSVACKHRSVHSDVAATHRREDYGELIIQKYKLQADTHNSVGNKHRLVAAVINLIVYLSTKLWICCIKQHLQRLNCRFITLMQWFSTFSKSWPTWKCQKCRSQ